MGSLKQWNKKSTKVELYIERRRKLRETMDNTGSKIVKMPSSYVWEPSTRQIYRGYGFRSDWWIGHYLGQVVSMAIFGLFVIFFYAGFFYTTPGVPPVIFTT